MAGRLQLDEEGEDGRWSDELQKLRNFIEAEFVKQSLHFDEIVEGLKPQPQAQAKSLKGQGLLGKTYSSVTLESREFCFDEHKAPPPLMPPPREEQEQRVEVAQRFSGKRMPASPTSGQGNAHEVDIPDPSPMRSAIQPDPSVAKSEDTFFQGWRKSIHHAEAAQSVMENSVEGVKRLSRGIQRTGTVEIDVDTISPCRSFCYRVVSHWAFTNCVMLLILVNLVLLGIEVDTATELGQFDIPRWFGVVNTLIVCVFLAEIGMKFIAFGFKGFLCGKDSFWNNLDFLVIAASVLEIGVELWDLSLSSTQSGSSAAHLRIMRTMRLVRALRGIRVIRLLRYVSALRTLVFSIVSTMGSLMWTLVLLQLLFYSFGVILTQIVSDHCRFEAITKRDDSNAIPECSEELLVRFWKNVPESMCTLLLAISGGLSWNDAFRPLRDVSALAVVLFILYIILTVFAVLNVVTGVFCNTAIESAQSDKDIAIMKQMRKHDAQVQAPVSYWSPVTADDGQTYYYNLETGEAAWDVPPGGQVYSDQGPAEAPAGGQTFGAWMQCQTPEGEVYYYNQQTGETSWDLPAAQVQQPQQAQQAYNPFAQAEEAARLQRQQYEDALRSMQQAEEQARQQREQWDQIYAQHFAWYQQQQQQQAQAAAAAQQGAAPRTATEGAAEGAAAGLVPPSIHATMEEQIAFAMKCSVVQEMEEMMKNGASVADRKKALKAWQIKWHPDKNPDQVEVAKTLFQFLAEKRQWFCQDPSAEGNWEDIPVDAVD